MARAYSLAKYLGLLVVSCWVQAAWAGNAWVDFREDVIALHEKSIKGKPIRVETSDVQAFAGAAAKDYYFRDYHYYDQASGRLISHVRRAPDVPEAIYEAEVYIYDESGRLVRDYAVIMLPWQLKLPTRTFINLHDYPGELHVFRQFDASGDFFYESCEGRLDGKKVAWHLDSIDVGPKLREPPLYQACFGRLPMKPGLYIKPQ